MQNQHKFIETLNHQEIPREWRSLPITTLEQYVYGQLALAKDIWWFKLVPAEWEEKNASLQFLSEWHWPLRRNLDTPPIGKVTVKTFRLWESDQIHPDTIKGPITPREQDLLSENTSIILGGALTQLEARTGEQILFTLEEVDTTFDRSITLSQFHGQIICPRDQYYVEIKIGLEKRNKVN